MNDKQELELLYKMRTVHVNLQYFTDEAKAGDQFKYIVVGGMVGEWVFRDLMIFLRIWSLAFMQNIESLSNIFIGMILRE